MADRLTQDPVDIGALIRDVSGPGRGGLTTFTGIIRGHNHGKDVLYLEYEAYPPMVERVLDELINEVQTRWQGSKCAVRHRMGKLLPGDNAVVIAVAAPHRAAAFEACRHVIERIKHDVPIWKKEFYEDGSSWVACDHDDH